MNRAVLAAAGLLIGAGLLAGCSSGSDAAATLSPSPTPTPTPSSVVWAGDVCVARDGLSAAVGALGRNLSYDVTSERSALEQIDRQLRIQVLAVADNADRLGQALSAVPVDFVAANDLVVSVTKARADTSEAIDQTKASLDAMVNADSIVSGIAEAGRALVSAKAAFEAGQVLVSTVTEAASGANEELRQAFDAAPQCQASPSASPAG